MNNARRLLAAACLAPCVAWAQTPPNAGQLIQQVSPPPPAPSTGVPRITVEESPAARATGGGERIPVRGVRFTGNEAFGEGPLQALMQDAIGQALTLAELDALALRVTRYYRDRGYLVARAWLPPQDVSSGVVTFAVVEGRVGEVRLNNAAGVAASATAPVGRIQPGSAVSTMAFEDVLLRLSELPGVEVKSTLRPGAAVGTSDFLVDVLPGTRFAGSVDFDTFGNGYTGANRLGTSLFWNNPAGLGDQASLRLQQSDGHTTYGRVGYQLPVGERATRVGAAYSRMDYELGRNFAPLRAHGGAEVASLYLQQPLLRTRPASWSGTLQYDAKRLHDRIDATGARFDKSLHSLTAGLNGSFTDGLGGGAGNALSVSYTRGELSLDAASAAIDTASARSAGGFGKWQASYQRVQNLPAGWSLSLNARAQWAGKNLDSSEKMLLGGAGGVRAYPEGEASGDEGHLVNVELRKPLGANWDVLGFYDEGRVRISRAPWLAVATNHTRLAGYGLGGGYTGAAFSVRVFLAWRAGTPAPKSDVDRSPRAWLQAAYRF